MRIAYLTNQYPKVSHTFIRREIAALEAKGIAVERFTIRASKGELAGQEDRDELLRTRSILSSGLVMLIVSTIMAAVRQPVGVARALGVALAMSRRSDRGIVRHIAYLVEACVLLRWVRRLGVQHVHAHFGTNPAAVAMLCHIIGGPQYSFTVHGSADLGKSSEMALGEKVRRAAFVAAVCEFGRSQLLRCCKRTDWPRIRIVRCGVDDLFLRAPRTPIPAVPRLVCVGRLCVEKGQVALIDAVADLREAGTSVEVILIGDGPMRGEIESLIAKRGLSHCVRLTGWASSADVRNHILGSRAVVLPSLYEGLPVAIMEAFALHRPVISTHVCGIPELVEHGVNGWLVPPGSSSSLAAAIREALETPTAELECMAERGAARAAEMHDAGTEAGKLADLFRQCIESGRAGSEAAAMLKLGQPALGVATREQS